MPAAEKATLPAKLALRHYPSARCRPNPGSAHGSRQVGYVPCASQSHTRGPSSWKAVLGRVRPHGFDGHRELGGLEIALLGTWPDQLGRRPGKQPDAGIAVKFPFKPRSGVPEQQHEDSQDHDCGQQHVVGDQPDHRDHDGTGDGLAQALTVFHLYQAARRGPAAREREGIPNRRPSASPAPPAAAYR